MQGLLPWVKEQSALCKCGSGLGAHGERMAWEEEGSGTLPGGVGYRRSEHLRNFFRVKYQKFLEVCFLNRTNKQETNPARVVVVIL